MSIYKNHRALFKNLMLFGLLAVLASIILFWILKDNYSTDYQQYSNQINDQYISKVCSAAYQEIDYAVNRELKTISAAQFDSLNIHFLAETLIVKDRFPILAVWKISEDTSGITRDQTQISQISRSALKSGADFLIPYILEKDSAFLFYRRLETEPELGLMISLKASPLIERFDLDKKIEKFGVSERTAAETLTIGYEGGLYSIYPPVWKDLDYSAVFKLDAPITISGLISRYGVYLVLFLPLLLLAGAYGVITRYLNSYSDQANRLTQIFGANQNGNDLFRRDNVVVSKNMPELSQLYGMVKDNIHNKELSERAIEIVCRSIDAVAENGFDRKASRAILEVICRSLGCGGGAILAINSADKAVSILSESNFDDSLKAKVSEALFLEALMAKTNKYTKGVVISNLESEYSIPLFEAFITKYSSTYLRILRFNSQYVGLIILTSQNRISIDNHLKHLMTILAEIVAAITRGIEIEEERVAKNDKTLLLQDTSLAISSTLELSAVLWIVASRLNEYASSAYCIVLLNSETDGALDVATYYTKKSGSLVPPTDINIHLADFPKLHEAINIKQATIIGGAEVAEMSEKEKSFFNGAVVKRIIVLPISHSGKLIGSVVMGEDKIVPAASVGIDKIHFMQAMISQAAAAIENARLYGFIKQKVDQLTVLYNVSATIHSETNVNSMLEKVLNSTIEYLKLTSAAIYYLEDNTRTLKPIILGNSTVLADNSELLKLGSNSTISLAATSGETVILGDTRVETDVYSSFDEDLSEMAVPIQIGEKIIGIFSIGSSKKNAFTQLEEEFMGALAAQIAVAFERDRLFTQERERAFKLKTIFNFSQKLSDTLNLGEVLKVACESIQHAFRYPNVSIFLLDEDRQALYIGYQLSSDGKNIPFNFSLQMGEGLIGKVAQNRKTIYCPDVSKEPFYIKTVEGVQSEVCIPIIAADSIKGILNLESTERSSFNSDDIATMEALADILAVAMNNAMLFKETIEKAERLSLLDNINKAISATLDLNSFFNVVARAVSDNAGYKWTMLLVPDGTSFVYKAGYSQKSIAAISSSPVIELIGPKLRQVLDTAQPVFVAFAELAGFKKKELLQPVIDAGVRHLALLPIGNNSRVEAILAVGSSHPDGFSSQEFQLLSDLALHLRIAWQNAQLYEQLKTAYNQLQDAQDRIVQTEKLRALGEMSSGVVHDFNNILAAILGRIQILLKKVEISEKPPEKEFLLKNMSLIEKAAEDGSHILSRIAEFTKKKPTEKFVTISMEQIINDVIEFTKPRWREQSRASGKDIQVYFNGGRDLLVNGSPSELREVFTNLINNAVDAIESKGIISIEASQKENEIAIIVSDSGKGMPEEIRKKIFEPFFTTKGARGTGLGLSVTYGIINRHGGTIDVESFINKGTKFTIKIPALKHSPVPTPKIHESLPINSIPNILIVDDEEDLRSVLVELISSNGFNADSVATAREALEVLQTKKYNIIITDLGLPDISGWDLADMVYREYPSIKVILTTGWGAQIESSDLVRHHINGLISKPFKVAEILMAMENIIGLNQNEVRIENT